ncbi:MAG: T9SS type A sorting domain-containing protein, partial [Bacteroidota bacterium]|nr:T9SS type A sorting domain-containing protein [Bacteroidota bacterium]
MKKIFFTIFSLVGGAFSLIAQQADLSFSNFRLVDADGITQSTVIMGNSYYLAGTLTNNSNVDFSGDITLNVHADPNADVSTKVSEGEFVLGNFSISAQDVATFKKGPFLIDPDIFDDTTNIVITWPTISYSDAEPSNNYGIFTVTVLSATGIADGAENKSFTLYPNPATGQVTLDAQQVNGAVINITDLQGRTVR